MRAASLGVTAAELLGGCHCASCVLFVRTEALNRVREDRGWTKADVVSDDLIGFVTLLKPLAWRGVRDGGVDSVEATTGPVRYRVTRMIYPNGTTVGDMRWAIDAGVRPELLGMSSQPSEYAVYRFKAWECAPVRPALVGYFPTLRMAQTAVDIDRF